MSDVAAIEPKPEPYQNRPNRIDKLTPRVKAACNYMVWEGLPFDEAATKAGLTIQAMRYALAKPHVLRYLKEQQQVLRGSEGPRSIHRIREIRDAAENKPALDAAMWFVTEDAAQQRGSAAQAPPGVTIRIVNVVAAAHAGAPQHVTAAAIEHEPAPALPDSAVERPGGENR